MIRLDKYLADMSIGTRQEVKKYIRQGRVKINEDIIKKPEYKIREDEDKITFDGAPVAYETFEYYMLNKPAGVISATEDKRDKTVLDLIKEKKRKDLFPVGRLDKDTEGLLLITNDGALAHRLLSPKKHVDKCYYAEISGGVTEDDVRVFKERINIWYSGRTRVDNACGTEDSGKRHGFTYPADNPGGKISSGKTYVSGCW